MTRWRRMLTVGTNPGRATAAGLALVVVIAVVVGALHEQVTRATQGLLLVVPLVGAAVLGGRRAAFAVSAAATVAYSLVIPPVGTFRVRVAQDLVALVVFSIVALVVGSVVARRIELLGEVERQRSALLRSVSHDLRTPLAAIRVAASELGDDAVHLGAAGRTRFAEVIVEESERLDRLVANLLHLSRIEAGAYAPAPQAVDLGELVEATTARLARLFTSVRLEVDGAVDDLPLVHGDHTQLDQLVTNLLENAARHASTAVRLELSAAGADVVLTVTDDGPGLLGADPAALFEPFRSGAVPGATGVGLAICKAVAEGHGGTIGARDRPGGGAVFTVRLPAG